MLCGKRVVLQSFVVAVHYSALRRVVCFFRVNVSSFLDIFVLHSSVVSG